MATPKERAFEIMQDCIDSDFEYMIVRIEIRDSITHDIIEKEFVPFTYDVTIRGKENMKRFIDYMKVRLADDLHIKSPFDSKTLISVAGANVANDLYVIDDALKLNSEYILGEEN